MTKHLTVLIAFLMMIGTPAVALTGSMRCEIKDQKLLEISDGIPSSYSKYEGELSTGGRFSLIYTFSSEHQTVEIKTTGGKENGPLNAERSFSLRTASTKTVNRRARVLYALGGGMMSEMVGRPVDFLEWRPDSINIGYIAESSLNLRRYYKSDWMGMYSSVTALRDSPIISHVITFDCKHNTPDRFQDMFELAQEIITE